MPRGGARPNSGPKEKDPAAIARALELLRDGVCSSPQDAAEHPEVKGRIGWRQIHDARAKAQAALAARPAPKRPPRKPAPKLTATARLTAATDVALPAAPLVVPRPPPGLSPRSLRVWYIEQEITAINLALAQARALGDAGLTRIGTLTGHLRAWLDELAKLAPPEPPSKEDAEALWRVDADRATAKIREGVSDARGRMAALLGTPFRGSYLELVGSTPRAAGP